ASEHKHGPSWLLSDKDREALAEAAGLANQNPDGTAVVGMYRSQTRAGAAPAPEDEALLEQFAACGARMFLLVKPEAGQPSTVRLFEAGEGLRGTPGEFQIYRGMQGTHTLPADKAVAASASASTAAAVVPATAGPSTPDAGVPEPALPHPP